MSGLSIPQNAPQPALQRKKMTRKRDDDESDYADDASSVDSYGGYGGPVSGDYRDSDDEVDVPAPLRGGRRSKRARKMTSRALAAQEQAADFGDDEEEEEAADDDSDA